MKERLEAGQFEGDLGLYRLTHVSEHGRTGAPRSARPSLF